VWCLGASEGSEGGVRAGPWRLRRMGNEVFLIGVEMIAGAEKLTMR
jgi:hypothetical protein